MRSPRVAFSSRAALVALLVIAALVTLPVHTALAASPAQITADEATPLHLGEFVFREMANGESAAYQISIPEAATYRITAVDEEKSVAFDLIVTDAAGNEVFNDIFETVELELDSGEATLQFIAVDAEALEFAVFAYFGTMSADFDQPGTLLPGSIYYEDRVNEERYALLSVPETPYPQQVFLYIEPGEEDVFDLSAEGDDIGAFYLTAEQGDLLHFWSQGGEYPITATPAERRSEFSIIPYLGGAPAAMTIDEPFDATIAEQAEVILELSLDVPYENLTIEAGAEVEEVNITLIDRLYDGVYYESAASGEPSLAVENIQAGVYYVIVTKSSLLMKISPSRWWLPGQPANRQPALTSGETVTGNFEEGDHARGLRIQRNAGRRAGHRSALLRRRRYRLRPGGGHGARPSAVVHLLRGLARGDHLHRPGCRTLLHRRSQQRLRGECPHRDRNRPGPRCIAVDGLTWGSVVAGERSVYQLEVTEPGDFLTVALVARKLDLDLYISGYTAEGYGLPPPASASGASEIASILLTEAGLYECRPARRILDEDGNFVLLTRLENPNSPATGRTPPPRPSTKMTPYSALQATGA